MAALGYDAMYAVYEAAKRATKSTGVSPPKAKDLAAALRGLSFTGVTGKITIGPDRTPQKAVVIVRAAGNFQFQEKISPDGAKPPEPAAPAGK
jgi:ABC-type branched-subunit amino acid transport system substrate-binding protein